MAGTAGKRDNSVGNSLPPIVEELDRSPGNFAFAQAVRLAANYVHTQAQKAPRLRYKVNPDLSFPPGDIKSIELNTAEAEIQIVLNLMGMHGAASPLPAYFTEFVAQHQDENDTLRDFFDIFNHQLISILYGLWSKYRYYIQYENNAGDKLSNRFLSFIGMGIAELRQAKALNWAKLLAYIGLIAFRGEAAGALESILRYYFNHQAVSIIPCIVRSVIIPADQLCVLGCENSYMNVDCHLGTEIPDQTGKFRIRVADLGWEKFNSFLPNGPVFAELKILVQFVLRSRLTFDLELRLLLSEMQPLCIGENSVCRLGWSAWLGDNGDGIVILETDR
jgi:type VI secretion system protein ImpH